jgi:anaphase-promoting complex subunit 4
MPESIKRWPTLPSDPFIASIHPPKRADGIQEEDLDEVDDTNVNSVLAVADSSGCIQCFLDGSYPLGPISIDPESTTASLHRASSTSVLYAFQRRTMGDSYITPLLPIEVNMTLLATRTPRDVARISSTACQLLWYAIRVVDDLRAVWIGSTVHTGAREPGIKWLSKLTEGQLAAECTVSCSLRSSLS